MPAFIVVLFIYCIFFARQKKNTETIFLLLSSLGSIGIGWSLKYIVDRDRPQVVEHLVQSYGASFPSAHSLYAAVLASFTALFVCQNLSYKYRNVLFCFIFSWPLAMGISRVYLGVHYLSDVLAGLGIGFIWVGLLYLCYQKKFMPYCHEKSKLKIEVKS
ncbi:phosphatase PAP2 family protein [Acinetobacter rathckeae]|uniref:phosphatase PAP2 family protein n=1 Tax=Acinetobacter rathckeae TaxID=2605272 RepID=UPI0018A2E949|nr:phosphatase PAP2 family protein [Acinetobacter rathckeae]MBF7686832.1 phosphatase PAP2 family protein [Acinetobacter rathckeae]MBF7695636.1 phosphatase PAP2 family protein [Acinetobacter rathckeae]